MSAPDRRTPRARNTSPGTPPTLRAHAGLPSLRSDALFPGLRRTLAASNHQGFRVLHFSVQADHLHLIVEADTPERLVRGVQGLAIRCARAINRLGRRRGPVWGERYHAHALETPRETRNAIVYVLMNFKKHRPRDPRVLDPCSSAPWFEGFRQPAPRPRDESPTRRARTWLASTGWKRHGLVEWTETPRSK